MKKDIFFKIGINLVNATPPTPLLGITEILPHCLPLCLVVHKSGYLRFYVRLEAMSHSYFLHVFETNSVEAVKGTRAQKIGLKSTYLKIHLGKSLSKEMRCMADTKKIDYIF